MKQLLQQLVNIASRVHTDNSRSEIISDLANISLVDYDLLKEFVKNNIQEEIKIKNDDGKKNVI